MKYLSIVLALIISIPVCAAESKKKRPVKKSEVQATNIKARLPKPDDLAQHLQDIFLGEIKKFETLFFCWRRFP